MITGILFYICCSFLMMTIKLHRDTDFFSNCDRYVRDNNQKQKERLLKKEISPREYKQSILNLKEARRNCVIVNFLVSPIMLPILTITFLLEMMTDIIETVKYWNL